MMNEIIKQKNNQSGFTLLLASLVASLLLTIGLSMFSIAQQQLTLSSIGRDSQYSFYTADTGAECALYWDFRGAFSTSTSFSGAKCNGQSIGEPANTADPNSTGLFLGGKDFDDTTDADYEFNFEQKIGESQRCIIVSLRKYMKNSAPHTEIVSRGYNVPCIKSGPDKGKPEINSHTLERAVRMRY
jgi:hypothetical protein